MAPLHHRGLLRRGLGALALALALPVAPARALEEVVVEMPLLNSTMTVRLSELRTPEALFDGNSELAEWIAPPRGGWGRPWWR
jgi:hypothetical protein